MFLQSGNAHELVGHLRIMLNKPIHARRLSLDRLLKLSKLRLEFIVPLVQLHVLFFELFKFMIIVTLLLFDSLD